MHFLWRGWHAVFLAEIFPSLKFAQFQEVESVLCKITLLCRNVISMTRVACYVSGRNASRSVSNIHFHRYLFACRSILRFQTRNLHGPNVKNSFGNFLLADLWARWWWIRQYSRLWWQPSLSVSLLSAWKISTLRTHTMLCTLFHANRIKITLESFLKSPLRTTELARRYILGIVRVHLRVQNFHLITLEGFFTMPLCRAQGR